MEAVLETAVKRGADLVLIQEPRGEKKKDGTRSHPSFRFVKGEEGVGAKCWIAVNKASRARVTELKDLTRESGNYVQVVEVVLPGGKPSSSPMCTNKAKEARRSGRHSERPGKRSPDTGG